MTKRDAPSTAPATPPSPDATPPSNAADPLTNPEIDGRNRAIGNCPGEEQDMPPADPPSDTPSEPTLDVEELLRAHFARVASPEIRAAIRTRLKDRHVPSQELEAKISDVLTALLEMQKVPPTDERCLGAALDIAEKVAAMDVRKIVRARKVTEPLVGDADEHMGDEGALPVAPASFVHEEKHRVVEAALADGTVDARAAKMMKLEAKGLSHAQIGKKLGVAPQTVANTLSKARRDVRAAWTARAAKLGLLAVLAALASVGLYRRDEIAAWLHPDTIRPDDSSILPPAPPAPPRPDPRALALREQARKACAAYDSIGCEIALDEAKKLDPAGDDTPEVKAMREVIKNGDPRMPKGDGKLK